MAKGMEDTALETRQRLLEVADKAAQKGATYYQTVRNALLSAAQTMLSPARPAQAAEPSAKRSRGGGGGGGDGGGDGGTQRPQQRGPSMAMITILLIVALLCSTALILGSRGRTATELAWHDQATAADVSRAPNVWLTREEATAAMQWRVEREEGRRSRLTAAIVDGTALSRADSAHFARVCQYESNGWQPEPEVRPLPQMDGADADSDDDNEAGARMSVDTQAHLAPHAHTRMIFCDDHVATAAEADDLLDVGSWLGGFTEDQGMSISYADRTMCTCYLGVPLTQLESEEIALPPEDCSPLGDLGNYVHHSQTRRPAAAMEEMAPLPERPQDRDFALQTDAGPHGWGATLGPDTAADPASNARSRRAAGRVRVQESFSALAEAFTDVTQAMSSLHTEHPETALPPDAPLLAEAFQAVTGMMASMRANPQVGHVRSTGDSDPVPHLPDWLTQDLRHSPSGRMGTVTVISASPQTASSRVYSARATVTLEWPLSATMQDILTQALCHFGRQQARGRARLIHEDAANRVRTVHNGHSLGLILSAIATRDEVARRHLTLRMIIADDQPTRTAPQAAPLPHGPSARATGGDGQGFTFAAPSSRTGTTGAAEGGAHTTPTFTFTGHKSASAALPDVSSSHTEEDAAECLPQIDGHCGGADSEDADDASAECAPLINNHRDGANIRVDQTHENLRMHVPTVAPSATQRQQLHSLQPALTDLIRAISRGTRVRNILMCEENVAVTVRMMVDDNNAARSRQGIRALGTIGTGASNQGNVLAQECTPPLQAAWHTFTLFHPYVATANELPPSALESASRRVAASLGIPDATAREHSTPYSACPKAQTAPELGESRVFHGVRRMALRTAPLDFALHRALDAPFVGSRLTKDGGFAAPKAIDAPGTDLCRVILIPMTPAHVEATVITVWLYQDRLAAVEGAATDLGPVELRTHENRGPGTARASRFLPPEFRWTATFRRHQDGTPDYTSGLMIKPFDTTGVMRHSKAWPASIRYLSATCKTILQGRVHLPTVGAGIRMSINPNLGSVDNDKPLLYKLIAKYLISGVLQYCPPEHPPINIIPLGLVPKKDEEEPWRCILDARTLNEDLQYLPSSMCGIAASASLFTRGAFGFMKDISAAYHNVVLGSGCDDGRCLGCPTCKAPMTEAAARAAGGTVAAAWTRVGKDPRPCVYAQTGLQCLLGDMRAAPGKPGQPLQSKRRFFNVCAPGVNCKGSCQPQFYGIELDGVRFRYTVCPFGVRTSGNMWADLIAPVIAKYRSRGHRVIIWVDDVLVLTVNECTQQDSCGGNGTCTTCTACWQASTALEAEFQADLDSLGFETNTKNVPPTTTGAFLGLIFCTKTLTFSFPLEKATAFSETCSDLLAKGRATKRELASVTGKLCWWSPAILHVPLLTTGLTRLTGGQETPGKWDEIVDIDEQVTLELQHWRDTIEECARRPIPMIPPSLNRLEADWHAQSYFGRLRCMARRKKPSGRLWACTHQTPAAPSAPLPAKLGPYQRALAPHARRRKSAEARQVKLPRELAQKIGNKMLDASTVIYAHGKRYNPVNNKAWKRQPATAARPRPSSTAAYDTACRFLLCTDAGPLKWGATLRTHTGKILRASGTYPATDASGVDKHKNADEQDLHIHEQQPWREGYASLMGVLSFTKHIRGQAVLHHGDCMCAVAAIRRGSAASTVLHRLALKIWKATSRHAIMLYSGWIPGKMVIKLGADGLSREEGYDWGGVSATGNAWKAVETLLARHQWQLTVDLFASEENAKAQRFYSMYHEPKSEAVDAFTEPSWAHSLCQPCGSLHRETVLAFPPHALLTRAWGKLERDGARGIAIMKYHVSHPAYPIMMRGKIGSAVHLTGKDFTLPTGCGATLEKHGVRTDKYIAVAFDFSVNPHSAPPLSPAIPHPQEQHRPCPAFASYRECKPPPSKSAQEDMLLRLALAESTRQAREGELAGYNGN